MLLQNTNPLLYNKLHLALASNISVLSILYVNLPWAAPVEPVGYEKKNVSLVNFLYKGNK